MKRTATLVLGLSFAFGVSAADRAPDPAPTYNQKTVVELSGPVVAVHEVSSGALAGVYLTIKGKGEGTELYLAPAEFIKIFDVQFKVGDDVRAIGSKVKFENRDLVLVREIERGKVLLTLRDANGEPQWLWLCKPEGPTGF